MERAVQKGSFFLAAGEKRTARNMAAESRLKTTRQTSRKTPTGNDTLNLMYYGMLRCIAKIWRSAVFADPDDSHENA